MHPEFWFGNFPPELATFLLAMIPLTELRASIPIGILYYHLSPWMTFSLSVLGSIVPMIFIVYLLGPVSKWLSQHSKLFSRFFNWLFSHTRKNFSKKYEAYGALALIIFVAIPLPVTGAWTGAVASFLYGIKPWRAVIYISLGVFIAGTLVTLITLSGLHIAGI